MEPGLAPTIYFENAAGRLLEDPAGFLRAHWSPRPRRLVETQALFTHMTEALRRRNWSRILINQAEMPPFTVAEQQWVAQQWLPQAVQHGGYRHGAVVVSPDVMVRLATAYITTSIQGLPLQYRSFEDEEQARQWLLLQTATPQL